MARNLHTPTKLSDADLDLVVGGIVASGRKHLATIKHPTLDAATALGSSDALEPWIAASYDKGFVQKNAELIACNFNHRV